MPVRPRSRRARSDTTGLQAATAFEWVQHPAMIRPPCMRSSTGSLTGSPRNFMTRPLLVGTDVSLRVRDLVVAGVVRSRRSVPDLTGDRHGGAHRVPMSHDTHQLGSQDIPRDRSSFASTLTSNSPPFAAGDGIGWRLRICRRRSEPSARAITATVAPMMIRDMGMALFISKLFRDTVLLTIRLPTCDSEQG